MVGLKTADFTVRKKLEGKKSFVSFIKERKK